MDGLSDHPQVLKFRAAKMGQKLKSALGCVNVSGVPAATSLRKAIDQLVTAIQYRVAVEEDRRKIEATNETY